ncbi:TetR family transcriptional regulator [Mycobacteroides franklinii]|uniref:TetR family transcriptional regulator n=1 Tax=Mycobacteroides franklinii TaxID=948102 RepID=A0A1S1LBW1_9MYCO|nr:TetR/AcrR family transcriptional regulator [Mycobacteroides franklinii]OHU22703.1 TetR family transcriptional regulator [Mycobacteroides franklinii]
MPVPHRPHEADTVKRRPKDRKMQIAKASTEAFSESGYHAASMEQIAARVGISATGLYRHSASKYELFRDAVLALGNGLVEATDLADHEDADTDPRSALRALINGLIETTLANRAAGGLFRWEGRYLNEDDQHELAAQIKLVNRRLQQPLMAIRPALTSRERWTLSSAALSVIGSITDHRAALPGAEIRAILVELAESVLFADLPASPRSDKPLPEAPAVTAAAGIYEMLLYESMLLFNARGYRQTSMEDIAAALGIQASGIYRYFPGKADILACSFRRAADRISASLSRVLAETTEPVPALRALISDYVTRSFECPELAYLYYSERNSLTSQDRTTLRHIQRSTVQSWSALVLSARPDITPGHARFAVQAAFALAVDLVRLANRHNTEHAQASARYLMEAALLGKPATRTRERKSASGSGRSGQR